MTIIRVKGRRAASSLHQEQWNPEETRRDQTVERPIVEQILHKLNPYALFVFANRDLTLRDFVNVKYVAEEVTLSGVEARCQALTWLLWP